jgi:signal peptidase I
LKRRYSLALKWAAAQSPKSIRKMVTLKSIDHLDLLKLCQEVLGRGSIFQFRALGTSMFPFIRSGDLLTTRAVNPTDLSIGEVLLYQREGRSFVHRLIKKKFMNGTPQFITRGDHQTFCDPAICSSQILGKVICIERSGRRIHLDTPFQGMWGRVLASTSSWFYPLFRVVEWPVHLFRKLLSKTNLRLNRFRLVRIVKRRIFPRISYRMGSSSDASSLATFYETDLKELFQNFDQGRKYYLAETRGKVVGGLTAGRAWQGIVRDHHCWIMGLYVVPRCRGTGIAEGLFAKAISALKEQGIDQIFINLFENNKPAFNLYQKLGFVRADMPEVESKINEHYARVAPGSPRSFVLHRWI